MKKDIKKKILDSIAYVRGMGFTLVSEYWGDANHKCACAISCLLLQDDPKDVVRIESREAAPEAANLLGVTEAWVDSFIEGFDGNGTADSSTIPEAWEVGFEVYKETKPIAYHLRDGKND